MPISSIWKCEFPVIAGVGSEILNIGFGQHLRRALVQLFCTSHLFKARQQIIRPKPAFFRTLEIVDDLAAVHHDQAVAQARVLKDRTQLHATLTSWW